MPSGQRQEYPEFELVLACLRWPQQFVDGERIRSLARQEIRWPYLLEIVSHHKVLPLFFHNLETFAADAIPSWQATSLRAHFAANAEICSQEIDRLSQLNQQFQEQGIAFRVFKGIPLALAAFQDPRLRDTGDIDLLVIEKDLSAADGILQEFGYQRYEPQARLTPRRLRSYLAHQKDFSYEHRQQNSAIDLHWRLFRNRFLPANAGLAEVGEAWIRLNQDEVPTLPVPQLLLYLCVHGALDGWLRLKWLADVSALLRTMTATDLAETVSLAKKQQALFYLSAACLLCHELLGNEIPDGCLDAKDRAVARILNFSRKVLRSNHYRPVREEIASTAWFLSELRLHHSLRYQLELMARSAFRPRVWQKIDLPDSLFPLYVFLGPIEWVIFHLQQRVTKLRRLARPPADIGLAIEAGFMLTFFRIALNFLPVQKLTAWMSRGNGKRVWLTQERATQTTERIEWSIGAVVRLAPVSFVCFPQCLAAYFMLRRRHIASKLFYGVAREANQLKTHTWVKVGDRTIVGGDVESRFTVLASFP
jgi:hypothetical protein